MEISKSTLKICKVFVKYIPLLIGIYYFITSILSCFGISIIWLIPLGNLSVLTFICMLAFSFLLKFCVWHRLSLYYSIIIDLINIIDFYLVIPVNSKIMLLIYLVVAGVFIFIGIYLKEQYNKIK